MIEVNYVAVVIAAIGAMVVGFFWYSKAFLGKPWMKLMGYTDESMEKAKKGMGKLYVLSFLLSLVTAYLLSHVMTMSQYFYGFEDVPTGLTSAFWMWLGFIMPVQATEVIFGGKKWSLFGINTGYQLAALLLMGIILGVL